MTRAEDIVWPIVAPVLFALLCLAVVGGAWATVRRVFRRDDEPLAIRPVTHDDYADPIDATQVITEWPQRVTPLDHDAVRDMPFRRDPVTYAGRAAQWQADMRHHAYDDPGAVMDRLYATPGGRHSWEATGGNDIQRAAIEAAATGQWSNEDMHELDLLLNGVPA